MPNEATQSTGASTVQNTGADAVQQAAVAAAAGAAAAPAAPAPAAAATAVPTQQADGGQTAEGNKPAAASGEGDGKPQGAPEKYADFKTPDGAAVDATVMTEFAAVAKSLNLSQDAAQTMIDKLAPKMAEQAVAAQTAKLAEARTTWQGQVRADKDIGGDKLTENLAVAQKAINAFGDDALRTLLNASGLGDHPALVRTFVKIGKAISEDKFVPGGKQPTAGEKDPAKVLYGTSAKTA